MIRGTDNELILRRPRWLGGLIPEPVRRVNSALRGAPKLSLIFIVFALLCAAFAPVIAPYDPIKTDFSSILAPPNSAHWMGADNQGRDILSRTIYGARISVRVAVIAVFLAAGVGTLVALIAGVFRGWVDTVLMRITDGFMALPYLMVALMVVSLMGASITNVILVIGLLRWMGFARVIRGEVLRLMEADFVRLARVAGASRSRIMFRHIFPNVINTLLVLVTLEIGLAVITESSLSFLGLGVPRPDPSWGSMLRDAQQYIYIAWWSPVFAGLAITMLVMSCNLVGDWLRDRTDPTRRQL
ncbi:MAG: peptide ABC transporter permease [Deltaproteobacteria bacterium]|nr:peptide ABC transporter permease [Deltaproteobacteria bacterium]